MLKSLLNLDGAKALNTEEKKSINGGCPPPSCFVVCPDVAARICGPLAGLYTGECDCNCF